MAKTVYIYESHLGGLYVEEEEIPWDNLYCETCGDSDWLVFSADNLKDVTEWFKEEGSVYPDEYVKYICNCCEAFLTE